MYTKVHTNIKYLVYMYLFLYLYRKHKIKIKSTTWLATRLPLLLYNNSRCSAKQIITLLTTDYTGARNGISQNYTGKFIYNKTQVLQVIHCYNIIPYLGKRYGKIQRNVIWLVFIYIPLLTLV